MRDLLWACNFYVFLEFTKSINELQLFSLERQRMEEFWLTIGLISAEEQSVQNCELVLPLGLRSDWVDFVRFLTILGLWEQETLALFHLFHVMYFLHSIEIQIRYVWYIIQRKRKPRYLLTKYPRSDSPTFALPSTSKEPPPGRLRVVGSICANSYAVTMRVRAWMFWRVKFSAIVPPCTLNWGSKSRQLTMRLRWASNTSSISRLTWYYIRTGQRLHGEHDWRGISGFDLRRQLLQPALSPWIVFPASALLVLFVHVVKVFFNAALCNQGCDKVSHNAPCLIVSSFPCIPYGKFDCRAPPRCLEFCPRYIWQYAWHQQSPARCLPCMLQLPCGTWKIRLPP